MNGYQRFNKWLASKVTGAVGTMTCAYVFAALTFVSLPTVIASGNVVQIIAWITQTFLQLVLLSVLMVGQNIGGEASERRAVETHEIVKKSHAEQMQELRELRSLVREAQEERRAMRKLLNEMASVLQETSGKTGAGPQDRG